VPERENGDQSGALEKSRRGRAVSAGWRAIILIVYLLAMLILFLTTITSIPSHESLFETSSTANQNLKIEPSSAQTSSQNESGHAVGTSTTASGPVIPEGNAGATTAIWIAFCRLLDKDTYPQGRSIALVFFSICLAPYPLTAYQTVAEQ
jgi:hypothetical protein